MAVADKIVALLDTMTVASLDSLSPVRRRQFGDLCRHWADIAERPKGQLARPRMSAPGRDVAAVLAGAPHAGAIEGVSAKPPAGEI
jgi:hypothetical protein